MVRDTRGTLIIVSPDEKVVLRFPVNTFLAVLVVCIAAIVILGIFLLQGPNANAPEKISELRNSNSLIAANLDAVTEEVRELLRVNNIFSTELEQTLSSIYPESLTTTGSGPGSRASNFADAARFFGASGSSSILQQNIQSLSNSFRIAAPAVEQIREVLEAQHELLRKIPSYWPAVGSRMGIIMEYGPRIHPFTRAWYIHKGSDIVGPPGTPIVAAADGRVVRSEFDTTGSGYGNIIVLEHAYGYSTVYAHMVERRVSVGQQVRQGQQIGSMGMTGLATGVHLHYEIKVSGEIIDAAAFLAIRNNFYRWEHLLN